jgi:branched-chain amino acid transport system substrate-binding protein
MQEWDGSKYVKVSGDIKPNMDKVSPLLNAAAKEYTDKAGSWPKRTEACDKAS